ncbi:2373_t:CDS:2, partial [Gigaspora margarita]
EYRDYLENLPFTIGSSSTIHIFLDIIKLLKSSLTNEIFKIQKVQIDICFEYFSRLIPSNQYETCNEVDNSDISNCFEDSTNKYQIALNSIINRNLNQDYLISNAEIKNSIATWQIYGECSVLGHKLASLAAKFCLIYIATTLQGLIQQIENTSSNNTSQDQDIICNSLQASTKGRHAKQLKASVKNIPKSSKNKMT